MHPYSMFTVGLNTTTQIIKNGISVTFWPRQNTEISLLSTISVGTSRSLNSTRSFPIVALTEVSDAWRVRGVKINPSSSSSSINAWSRRNRRRKTSAFNPTASRLWPDHTPSRPANHRRRLQFIRTQIQARCYEVTCWWRVNPGEARTS